ncbi:conserved hypothetical protein [Ricinus communis]|uniref:Uncharacterized protein n=1 Tax=Ricinus communis TaxID=3988 RepID=B9RPE8_RICCO|nr:conserved hypothetical protein [Ricinus communis]
MIELIKGYAHSSTSSPRSSFETTELLRKTSGNGTCNPEKQTSKTCKTRTGKQVAKTKTIAQQPCGVFFLIDTLTRKSCVTRKPGSKNPNEKITWTLQKLSCCSRMKDKSKGDERKKKETAYATKSGRVDDGVKKWRGRNIKHGTEWLQYMMLMMAMIIITIITITITITTTMMESIENNQI